MPNKLKAGVIGLGILGQQHAEFLSNHPTVDVVAVSDLRQSAAEQVAAKLGAAAFTNYDEMFKQHQFDFVVVATPDHLHRAPTLAAIAAGVPNILQEKPLATSLADADAIYNAVERAGTRFFIDFANRAVPTDIATRYVIQNGLLGRMVYGEARLDDNISVPTQMWGARTKDFAAGSSTAHFLLSHVVDLLRWYFAPAEVTDVYAISQQTVLGYTPDLYDAFLTFNSGLKVRVKAEWIKHMDQLVEFYLGFSGSEGTLIYNKAPGFGVERGWRANLSAKLSADALLQHQATLLELGANVAAKVHRPAPTAGTLAAGGGETALALEHTGEVAGGTMALVGPIIDSILESTPTPASWQQRGPLPNHIDGLRQAQIVMAIIESSQTGQPVSLK
ncbi:MAG: Gfo/Idh/MocA family oxidoreductase [Chloroflexi bacterium]|nr:Gfo/Idh/MocA family oxidoreductase [Chloroflexota bacterium]